MFLCPGGEGPFGKGDVFAVETGGDGQARLSVGSSEKTCSSSPKLRVPGNINHRVDHPPVGMPQDHRAQP